MQKKNIVLILLFILFFVIFFLYNYLYANKNTENLNENVRRNAYLLTCNEESERTKFSKSVLEKVGFNVIVVKCTPNENKVLSNKNSMIQIYETIANGTDEWSYVFEDDINILEDIDINEIIEYEKISDLFFYLGMTSENPTFQLTEHKINNHQVAKVKGNVRGLHSIALSKNGAKELLLFTKEYDEKYYMDKDKDYMDMILEKFSEKYPANVVRYDLESYIQRHRGIFFQDRNKFETTI
jgi:hypothetical protein